MWEMKSRRLTARVRNDLLLLRISFDNVGHDSFEENKVLRRDEGDSVDAKEPETVEHESERRRQRQKITKKNR